MAQQTINIGAAPDDHTGDPARTAFDKCNVNFTELYGSVGGSFLPLGGGTLTGPLMLPVGSANVPSLTFSGTTTGLYGVGTTQVGIAISTVQRVLVTATSLTFTVPGRGGAGTAAAPTYSFTSDSNCGLYRSASGVVSMSTASTESMRWTGADNSTYALGPFIERPPASITPANNGDMVFQLTSNTTLTVKVKGSDGVVRSAALTLA